MFPLDLHQSNQPNSPSLLWHDRQYDFFEIAEIIDNVSQRILAFSQGHSFRVGILSSSSDLYLIAVGAALKSGCTTILLPTYWTTEEQARALGDCPFDLILFDEHNNLQFTELECEYRFKIDEFIFDAFWEQCQKTLYNNQYLASSLVIFTSGSSGIPKRVVLPWQALEAHAKMSEQHLLFSNTNRWLITLPLFHIGGISSFMKSMMTGLSLHLLDKFEATEVNDVIESGTISHLSLVPTTLQRLLAFRNNQPLPDCVQLVLIGGGSIPTELLERDPRFVASYGMSEAGSQITTVPPNSELSIRRSAGLPLPGVTVEIRNESDEVLQPGFSGEIYVKSPAAAIGYEGNELESKKTFKDGWIRTGDLGYLTPQGTLIVAGRQVDRIVSGGENISPSEIEQILMTNRLIRLAVVFGVPDKDWGEAVVAAIELTQTQSIDDLKQFLHGKLSGFKIPKYWLLLDEIPTLPNGKPNRERLFEIFTRSQL